MKKLFLTLAFAMALSTLCLAQSFIPVNGLSGRQRDRFGYKSHIALYPTVSNFTTTGCGAVPANTFEYYGLRVMSLINGNYYYNKLTYVCGSQVNMILTDYYSTSDTSWYPTTLYDDANGGPVQFSLVVQNWNGSSWVTSRTVGSLYGGEVSIDPQVNLTTGNLVGGVYDSNGNYIKYHDGSSASPKTTNGQPNYFVPYVTGAYRVSDETYVGSGVWFAAGINTYLASNGSFVAAIPFADIYGGRYFHSGYEGIQQINFKIPSDVNTLKFVFRSSTVSGYPYSTAYGGLLSDYNFSMGTNWY